MPFINPYRKKQYRVLCYKCDEYGYLGVGWTRNKYRRHRLIYQVNYIRHYSSKVFHDQMIRYRNHEIKSRPNGQKRCYIPRADIYPKSDSENNTFCCYLDFGKDAYVLNRLD